MHIPPDLYLGSAICGVRIGVSWFPASSTTETSDFGWPLGKRCKQACMQRICGRDATVMGLFVFSSFLAPPLLLQEPGNPTFTYVFSVQVAQVSTHISPLLLVLFSTSPLRIQIGVIFVIGVNPILFFSLCYKGSCFPYRTVLLASDCFFV